MSLVVFWARPVAADPPTFQACCCKYVDTDRDNFFDSLDTSNPSGTCHYVSVQQNQFCQDVIGDDPSWINVPMTGLACDDNKVKDLHLDKRTPAEAASSPVGAVNFKPQVTIPELGGEERFKAGTDFPVSNRTRTEGGKSFIYATLLSEYLWVWYRLLVYLAGFLAMVMIVWGGFKWMWGAGNEELIGSAKHTIVNAIMGLFLAFGAYLVLAVINPELVQNRGLKIQQVQPRLFQEPEEDASVSRPVYGPANPVTGIPGLATFGGVVIPDAMLLDLRAAAAEAVTNGHSLLVTSGFREPEQQEALIMQNCPSGARRSSDCNPPTCLMRNSRGACPHTSGRAIDVWATRGTAGGGQEIMQPQCLQDVDVCRNQAGQKVVGKALENNNFCNIASEPWHFEWDPGVSSGCTKRYGGL